MASHQYVGFPLCFLQQQQGQELAQLWRVRLRGLSSAPKKFVASVPPSPNPCFWGHELLAGAGTLCLQYEGNDCLLTCTI